MDMQWLYDEKSGWRKLSITSTIRTESNSKHHKHFGAPNKNDISPDAPTANKVDL